MGSTWLRVNNFINLCDGEVLYVCDSDKQKQGNKWAKGNTAIISPAQLVKNREDYSKIIISSAHYQ